MTPGPWSRQIRHGAMRVGNERFLQRRFVTGPREVTTHRSWLRQIRNDAMRVGNERFLQRRFANDQNATVQPSPERQHAVTPVPPHALMATMNGQLIRGPVPSHDEKILGPLLASAKAARVRGLLPGQQNAAL